MNHRFLESLTAEDFRGALGVRFRLTGALPEDHPPIFEVELVDVSEYPPGSPGMSRAPFSVMFHGPVKPVLPQGIYRLEQEGFGTLELFIVPIGLNVSQEPGGAPSGMRYEAVFG